MSNIKAAISRIKVPKTGAVYGIVILVILFSVCTNKFLTIANFNNVIHQAAVLCILTICSFLAILTHQVDLSIGGIAGLSGVISAQLFFHGMPLILAYLIGIAVCLAIGVLNGILIGYTNISPFIITLSTMGIAESLGMVIVGSTVQIESEAFKWLDNGSLCYLPIPLIIVAVLYLLFGFILKSRRFGTYLYAVGGREDSALASGINVKRMKVSVFVINSFLAALAGLILSARLGSANPSQGIGLELDGICGAVLGGTALTGGKGTILGALLGALALAILRNGLNMVGMAASLQMIVTGMILVLILTIDVLRRGRE